MEKPAEAEREVAIQVMVPPAVHKQVALMSVQQGREHAHCRPARPEGHWS